MVISPSPVGTTISSSVPCSTSGPQRIRPVIATGATGVATVDSLIASSGGVPGDSVPDAADAMPTAAA
jgi:hypothetical protein